MDEEEDNHAIVAKMGIWHEAMPVNARSLTIDFFLEAAEEAKQKGCTHWGTQTDRSQHPWVTTLLFYTPEET